mmetsp:Transcript_17254/g.19558  ORF Transcript_17254/g.19558 Transcript_17254/m.19558 type:complete len:182 (+) Transcript_17254:168-713(+)
MGNLLDCLGANRQEQKDVLQEARAAAEARTIKGENESAKNGVGKAVGNFASKPNVSAADVKATIESAKETTGDAVTEAKEVVKAEITTTTENIENKVEKREIKQEAAVNSEIEKGQKAVENFVEEKVKEAETISEKTENVVEEKENAVETVIEETAKEAEKKYGKDRKRCKGRSKGSRSCS